VISVAGQDCRCVVCSKGKFWFNFRCWLITSGGCTGDETEIFLIMCPNSLFGKIWFWSNDQSQSGHLSSFFTWGSYVIPPLGHSKFLTHPPLLSASLFAIQTWEKITMKQQTRLCLEGFQMMTRSVFSSEAHMRTPLFGVYYL
jgi:hypothetical protein